MYLIIDFVCRLKDIASERKDKIKKVCNYKLYFYFICFIDIFSFLIYLTKFICRPFLNFI